MRQYRGMDRQQATAALLSRAHAVPAGRRGFGVWSDADGNWISRPAGEWASGYAVGLRWLAAAFPSPAADSEAQADIARAALAELSVATGPRSAFRAFRGYLGALPGDVLLSDAAAAAAVVAAGRAFASDRHRAAGIVPLAETAAEQLRPGSVETSIDAVGPAVGLLARAAELSGDSDLAELAAFQAIWHLETLVRADGSVAQYALLDPYDACPIDVRTGPQGLRADSTWARAQSWGIFAAASAARWLPDLRAGMLDVGSVLADWWRVHVPADGVSRWDFSAPAHDALDTSATAIAAASILRLAALEPGTPRADRHRAQAEGAVNALCTRVTTGDDGRPAGMLLDGCYHHRTGLATANELVWGDFHLLEALLMLTGRLDPLAY
jgi:unsaturated chondroitin disaccharide hydrolase